MIFEKIKEVSWTQSFDQITVELFPKVTVEEFNTLADFIEEIVGLQFQQYYPNLDERKEYVNTRTYTMPPPSGNCINIFPEPTFRDMFSYTARVLRACSRIGKVNSYQELKERLRYQLKMENLGLQLENIPLEPGQRQKYLGLK